MNLQELYAKISDKKDKIKEWELYIESHKKDLQRIKCLYESVVNTPNPDLYLKGINLLSIYGDVSAITNDDISVLGEAKYFMAKNPDRFLTEYAGAKRYGSFFQISNHKYGFGPSHGYTVASIGLRESRVEPLCPDEKEAILYVLENYKA